MKSTCTLPGKSVDEGTASVKTTFYGYVMCIVSYMNINVSEKPAASVITVESTTQRVITSQTTTV